MDQTFANGPRSLLQGVDAIVCEALGIASVRHRSALHSLRLPPDINLAGLVYRVVTANWTAGDADSRKDRSRQNWRWTLQPQIGSANRSPEVVLERAIAAACKATGRSDWANQIPVASGLIEGASDGRRAIDLAQRRDDGSYEVIELKVASDTPLYATVELLGYVSVWLLARNAPPAEASELLRTDDLHLRVLAPAAFYAPYRLVDLEEVISCNVQELGRRSGVSLSFGFDVLPDMLLAMPPLAGGALLHTLAKRHPLHSGSLATKKIGSLPPSTARAPEGEFDGQA